MIISEETIKSLAKDIKEIRKKSFKTQELFSQHIGMTYSKYARFEKSGQISLEGFLEILQGLGKLETFFELFRENNLLKVVEPIKSVQKSQIQEIVVKEADTKNEDIKRVVSFFDHERKKLQPSYVRKEYKNFDGEYLLRLHLKESKRTPKMFADAVRWLFSNNPKAAFHRQYIMNIGKLIEHFNSLEHQAMYSEEAVAFNDEAKAWYNVYKKQGLADEEIMQILKDGGYIK
jgi:transcriptional regulator with XRE-family HTH domain